MIRYIFLVVSFHFCFKASSQGSNQWAAAIGTGNYDEATFCAKGPDNSMVVIGTFTDVMDADPSQEVFDLNSNGSSDIFIIKLDSSNNLVWAKGEGMRGLSGRFDVRL